MFPLTPTEMNEIERRIRFAERYPESGMVRLDPRIARMLYEVACGAAQMPGITRPILSVDSNVTERMDSWRRTVEGDVPKYQYVRRERKTAAAKATAG